MKHKNEYSELISVIIPTYNRANIMLDSINSVLNQTYNNIELIVVDDGSSDNTREVLEKIDDERFRFISLPQNSGMCFSRNVGTRMSNGKFIAIHDSDDLWKRDKLEKQLEFMRKNDCDLSFCKLERIDMDGNKKIIPQTDNIVDKNIYRRLLGGNFIASITIVMKRELAEDIEFDTEVKRFTDWDFVLRVAKSGYKIGYLPEVLAISYIQQDSTATKANAFNSLKFIYDRYIDDINKYNDVKAIHLFNLGKSIALADKKTSNQYLIESMKTNFSSKVLLRLLLLNTGVLKLYKTVKQRTKKK